MKYMVILFAALFFSSCNIMDWEVREQFRTDTHLSTTRNLSIQTSSNQAVLVCRIDSVEKVGLLKKFSFCDLDSLYKLRDGYLCSNFSLFRFNNEFEYSFFSDPGMYAYHVLCLSTTSDTLIYCKNYAD